MHKKRIIRYVLLLWGIFFLPTFITPVVSQVTYTSRLITLGESLPSRSVQCVAQDQKGMMWFATATGISRFNGYQYEHFTSPDWSSGIIVRIVFNPKNELFVLTNTGLVYKKTSSGFERIHFQSATPEMRISDLIFDRLGQLWIVNQAHDQLVLLDSTLNLIATRPIWSKSPGVGFNILYKQFLRTDDAHRVYVHTDYNEVSSFDTTLLAEQTYVISDTLLPCPYLYDFFPDTKGGVIMLCATDAMFVLGREGDMKKQLVGIDFQAGKFPIYFSPSKNKLFYGRYHYELAYIDLDTGTKQVFPLSTEGYPNIAISFFIAESQTGNLWVGSELGVTVVTEQQNYFQTYDLDGTSGVSISGGGIRSINETDLGEIWFSTDHAPFYQLHPEEGVMTKFGTPSLTAIRFPSFYHGVTYRDGLLYAGNGLSYDIASDQTFRTGPFRKEMVVNFDAFGRYHTLGLNGLFVFDQPGGNIIDSIAIEVYPYNLMPDRNGDMWICTGGGLQQYQFGHGIVKQYIAGDRVNSPDTLRTTKVVTGLLSNVVYDAAFAQGGKLFVATTAGLNVIDTLTDAISDFDDITLPSKTIYSILPEGDSVLWLGTGNGLVRLDPASREFWVFTTADGLPHNEFNRHAKLAAGDGFYYMGGIDGICRFRPEEIIEQQKKKIGGYLCLEHAVVFDGKQTHKLTGDSLLLGKQLILSPRDRMVTFELALTDYNAPERNLYRFFLEGFDSGWGELQTNHVVTYSNLPAGKYIFHAEGQGADRSWSRNSIRMTIIVKESFYKTIWFPILLAVLLSGLIYSIVRYRFAQKLQMEKLRSRISRDLHDEVGGVLSGIAMQMDLLKTNAPENMRNRLKHIAESSRHAASKMRDVIWSVDASRDTFEDLTERMKAHINELLGASGVTWDFKTGGIPPDTFISSVVRQQVYLIFKEAINNIAKHAEATSVQIIMAPFHRKGLQLTIHDNGKGFNESEVRKGDGLRNMRKRAQTIQAELKLETDRGVRWILYVPKIS